MKEISIERVKATLIIIRENGVRPWLLVTFLNKRFTKIG